MEAICMASLVFKHVPLHRDIVQYMKQNFFFKELVQCQRCCEYREKKDVTLNVWGSECTMYITCKTDTCSYDYDGKPPPLICCGDRILKCNIDEIPVPLLAQCIKCIELEKEWSPKVVISRMQGVVTWQEDEEYL